jgi:hypothetical protein
MAIKKQIKNAKTGRSGGISAESLSREVNKILIKYDPRHFDAKALMAIDDELLDLAIAMDLENYPVIYEDRAIIGFEPCGYDLMDCIYIVEMTTVETDEDESDSW